MFSEILDRWTRTQDGNLKLLPFHPYPKASNRSAWNRIPSSVKTRLIKKGEDFLHFQYPALSATDFMDFVRTGNRERYQERLFNRRLAFNHLVLAECAEHEGRFMDDIVNGFFCICEESAWQLPAHNSYIRDTPQFILPDVNRPVVDLFAAETGAILSTAACLLQDELNLISPSILGMVQSNLETRIFKPYLTEHFWWMGDGKSHMNNWTSWCTQNVLLTSAFCLQWGSPCLNMNRILEQACKSLDYFLDEYGTDGCCDEGAQYFRHAGLTLFGAMEVLNIVSDNAFSSLYEEEKIRNIASYIFHVHVAGPYYVNFADCSPIAGRCGAREFLFGKRTKNEDVMTFAAADYRESSNQLFEDEHNLFYRLQSVFTHDELMAWNYSRPLSYPDLYYPSAGLFLARDNRLCLAVKAGDNDDSHNHNDVGSFTIYKNGKPLFIDVGVETYTQKTFSPKRYEIWTMQSRFHNLPTFGNDSGVTASDDIPENAGGIIQKAGESYCASQVSVDLNGACPEISMEIAPAYGDSRILSYKRTALLHKSCDDTTSDKTAAAKHKRNDSYILITDTYQVDHLPVSLTLMTYEKPEMSPACDFDCQDDNFPSLCLKIGQLGTCQITGASHVEITSIPITDTRLQGAWKHEIYKCQVMLDSKTNGQAVIKIS